MSSSVQCMTSSSHEQDKCVQNFSISFHAGCCMPFIIVTPKSPTYARACSAHIALQDETDLEWSAPLRFQCVL
eukprot:scaffold88061_cov36-Tisochrysis_lutea.AAC.5